MIDRVVAIVGPFRSGTSLVAQVVHRLGFPVALTIPAPAPPSWRGDWEDPELTLLLLQGVKPTADWYADYLRRRREQSRVVGFGGRVAVKSPLLGLAWEGFAVAARAAAGGKPPLVIRCYREHGAMARSLAAHPQLAPELQARVTLAAWRIPPDIEVGFEWAIDHPERAARAIAMALGVEDDAAVAAAAATIGRPTEYPPCPPSSQPPSEPVPH